MVDYNYSLQLFIYTLLTKIYMIKILIRNTLTILLKVIEESKEARRRAGVI